MAENWRYGEITEDKKLPVRFLDADGNPIALSSLYGYGVEVYTSRETIIKCGVNIDGYDDSALIPVDDYSFIVAMEGSLLPQSSKEIYAMTTIIIEDPDMHDGLFTDHCETVPIVYQSLKKTQNSL